MKKTVFLLLFIFLLHVSSVESMQFEARNSIDGLTFQAGSTVELVCTNNPYHGVHLFIFDSRKVFTCTASICKVTENYPESLFSFESDIDSGVFRWIVHAMEMKFNGKTFECADGSNHTYITATVKDKSTENTLIYQLFSLVFLVSLVIIILTCYRHRIKSFLKERNCCSCSSARKDMIYQQPMMEKPKTADSQSIC